MPTLQNITSFDDSEPPAGETPWVVAPTVETIEIVEPDADWPAVFGELADRIRGALGARVLDLSHVGSTSVPGLPAKPVIDVDLVVADPSEEAAWLPSLEEIGLVLTVREPWWHEHRGLRSAAPRANVHVFGPDAPEPWKHRIFRDHLRRDIADRDRYAEAKRDASRSANDRGETMMEYNRRKQEVVRDIYARAFEAAGLVTPPPSPRPRR